MVKQLMQMVANGDWPGWAVSISVLPLTISFRMDWLDLLPCFYIP